MCPVHDGAAVPSSDGDRRAVGMSGAVPLELVTARLRLAAVGETDLEELFALHSDPRAFVEDLTDPLTDREQMRWVLGRWRASWAEHGVGYLTVRAADGRARDGALPDGLLGVVGLTPLASAGPGVLSAYWRLAPAVTGRGVASEAMGAMLSRPELGGRAAEVVAVTASGNSPSRALAARLGFRPAAPDRPVPGGREGDVLLVRP